MGFLSSVYLWLLPLASLPFLIHLFFNRKYKILEFSSIKFLKELEIDSLKRVQLLEILLLIIRTLIIITIIVMISKPVFKSNTFNSYVNRNKDVHCVIGVDDSFSMNRSSNPINLRLAYLEEIENILTNLPKKSDLKIISLSQNIILYDGLVSDFTPNSLSNKMTYQEIDLLSFLLEIDDESNYRYNKELHIISDLQEYPYLKLDDKMLSDWNVFLHDKNLIEENLSIVYAKVMNEFISINNNIQIDVTIQNNGETIAKNALLILSVDNVNVGQEQIDINTGEVSTYTFNTIIDSFGNHECMVEIIYDKYDADNRYFLTLNIPENIYVGLLSDRINDYNFIESSLNAFNDSYNNITVRYTNELLSDENLLIQNDINFIFDYNFISNHHLEESLIENLEKGGNAYLFPSLNQSKDGDFDFLDYLTYNYSEMKFIEHSEGTYASIKNNNLTNKSLLGIFNQDNVFKKNFEHFKLYKYFAFNEIDNTNIAINGRSIWNSLKINEGSIDIFGFLPHFEWSDMPIKAPFISWIDYLISSKNKLMKTYEVGEEYKNNFKSYHIISPTNKDYHYKTMLNDIYIFTETGIHEVENELNDFKIYVNNSKKELLYKKAEKKLLYEKFHNLFLIEKNSDINQIILTARVGLELWKYFLSLAIFLLLIEMVISNQLYRNK